LSGTFLRRASSLSKKPFCGSNLKFKSPASQAGLKQLPVGTLSAKHTRYNTGAQKITTVTNVEGRAEDDGLELEAFSRRLSREPKSRAKSRDLWLTRPLDYFADSVQYPLATSSRRNPPEFNIRFALAIRNPTKVVTPKEADRGWLILNSIPTPEGGGWPALTLVPTPEGSPFKLRLGGDFCR